MDARVYFPLGKAYGEAFCNRIEETNWLLGNIKSTKHSLLIAPRRYGKSSLAENAIKRSKLPNTSLDLHLAVDDKDIEYFILKAVADLIGKSIGKLNKATNSIKRYVKTLSPKIVIGSEHMSLEIVPPPNSRPAVNVAEGLMLIEKLLTEKNKKAILFIDEFQVVGLIAKGKGIEGGIRSAAQEMQHLSMIFSGSNRTTLRNMFEDESRPLYKLCRKLTLKRIAQEHYCKHINAISQETWGKHLETSTFQAIMDLTQKHPYYVNYLCDVLWSVCKCLPTKQETEKAWHTIIEEERSDLLKEFLNLADSQRKLLIHIANVSGENLLSKTVSAELNLSVSTMSKAIRMLLEKDIIEKSNHYYTILNPALHTLLNKDVKAL